MSNSNAKPLQCIFYSHPWTALLLKQIKSIDFTDSVLVELSNSSILSQVIPTKQSKIPCITQVLSAPEPAKTGFFKFFSRKKKHIFQEMAHQCKEMPAPLVFAPRPDISALNQISSLLICTTQPSPYAQVIVLIHYEEAQNFSSLYDYVDKFHVLWDLADFPGVKLTELTQLLINHHNLNDERWGGFHLCHHASRQISDSEERQALFESVMDDYLLKI
jgi:hypothetical protein